MLCHYALEVVCPSELLLLEHLMDGSGEGVGLAGEREGIYEGGVRCIARREDVHDVVLCDVVIDESHNGVDGVGIRASALQFGLEAASHLVGHGWIVPVESLPEGEQPSRQRVAGGRLQEREQVDVADELRSGVERHDVASEWRLRLLKVKNGGGCERCIERAESWVLGYASKRNNDLFHKGRKFDRFLWKYFRCKVTKKIHNAQASGTGIEVPQTTQTYTDLGPTGRGTHTEEVGEGISRGGGRGRRW